MINFLLSTSIVLFGIAIVITFIRILLGPSFSDRVIAMDVIGVNLLSTIAILSIIFDTKAYLEAILVLGILAFISTIAFSRFIERGKIIERKRN